MIKQGCILKRPNCLKSIGVDVDTRSLIINLGVADQQMVEISKALAVDARILVLDEPTSALSLREIEQLFKTIKVLKSKGVGIIYISHRLEEINQIGDRVTVMRDGKLIDTKNISDVILKCDHSNDGRQGDQRSISAEFLRAR